MVIIWVEVVKTKKINELKLNFVLKSFVKFESIFPAKSHLTRGRIRKKTRKHKYFYMDLFLFNLTFGYTLNFDNMKKSNL